MKRETFYNQKQILAFTDPQAAISVQVSPDGAVEKGGKKMILAGTPIGGDAKAIEDETAVLSVTNDEGTAVKTQGVLVHDVDVTDGEANGSMLLFGFVNEYRLDESLTISPAAKEALDGKVTFVKRNK